MIPRDGRALLKRKLMHGNSHAEEDHPTPKSATCGWAKVGVAKGAR